MHRRFSNILMLLAAVGLASAESDARAEHGGTHEISLKYAAPDVCPDQAQFWAALRARNPSIVPAAEHGVGFDVIIEAQERSFAGRVTARDRDQSILERSVVAQTCDEVAAALVLIVLLSVDPEQAAQQPTSSTPPVVPPQAQEPKQPEPRKRETAGNFLGIGGLWIATGADMATAIAPKPVVAIPASVELALGDGGLKGAAIRLGAIVSSSATVATSEGEARLRWIVGRIDGTVPVLRFHPKWTVRAGLGVEAGALGGEGVRVVNARSRQTPWVSVSPLSRLAYCPWPWLRVEAEAALHLPLTQQRFWLQPDVTVHRVPGVGFLGGVGVAMRIF